jgi:hypothetical protein
MTMRQIQWAAAYAFAVTIAILVLSNQSRDQANAQVVPPHTYNATRNDASTDSRPRIMSKTHAVKASDIIGMDVRAIGSDDTVGSINDLVIQKDGRVAYAAVSFGGFLGMGDKLFAVPVDAIEFVQVGEGADADVYARIDVSEQTLKNRQGFDQDHWPDEADTSFLPGNQRVGRAVSTEFNE